MTKTTVRISGQFLVIQEMEKKRFALKKLMEAVEKELLHKPNRKTLDRLSLLAGFQNWDSFQEALHGEADATTNFEETKK